MKKILFIINPISGKKRKDFLVEKIRQKFDNEAFDVEIAYTEHAGHGAELAAAAVLRGTDVIAAVGGDGTINEVASQLLNTNTTLAIVPLGSGNGLAHHLAIPQNANKCLQLIADKCDKPELVDTCSINDDFFFSIAGVGYDAKVAYDFNHGNERGFHGYFKYILKDYFNYNYNTYIIDCDGDRIEKKAFFITFANSSQWGYNVKIQPKASVQDGLVDVCIAKKPHWFALGDTVASLLMNRIDHRKLIEYKKCKELVISIKDGQKMFWHVDGDSREPVEKIVIKIIPHSLKVICGD
ncbi:MAG: YegS/Rv2252/BmrU family lipid kinase [Bacteroidales bacterium]|nr:YegS/Rv2252/BmrU family lipid kinase [Bacteroidales bacterium]